MVGYPKGPGAGHVYDAAGDALAEGSGVEASFYVSDAASADPTVRGSGADGVPWAGVDDSDCVAGGPSEASVGVGGGVVGVDVGYSWDAAEPDERGAVDEPREVAADGYAKLPAVGAAAPRRAVPAN